MPPPFNSVMDCSISTPPLVSPEFNENQMGSINEKSIRFGLPSFAFSGSVELMAVPKKKVSKHKRGIRNGPKALKPTPVIIRCTSCGRVKLPQFFCCSGERIINQALALVAEAYKTSSFLLRLHPNMLKQPQSLGEQGR